MNILRRAMINVCRATASTASARVLLTQMVRMPKYSFSDSGKDMGGLKQEAKEFYNQQIQTIVEIQKMDDWKTFIEQNPEPVVLDCYADWCKPCKQLTPILEEQAKNAKGWKLVKLNIDKFPQIANALQVKAVPSVFLIAAGRGIDGFQGMPDQTVLSRFFGTLQQLLKYSAEGQQQSKKMDEARQLVGQGKYPEAEQALLDLDKPNLASFLQPLCSLLLAECFLRQGKLTHYTQRVKLLHTKYKAELETQDQNAELYKAFLDKLNQQYELALQQSKSASNSLNQKKKAVEANPTDLGAKYSLAEEYVQVEQLEDAMKVLLQIVKADKNWQDKKANKLMLEIFKKLGLSSQLTVKYRKLYQRLLY